MCKIIPVCRKIWCCTSVWRVSTPYLALLLPMMVAALSPHCMFLLLVRAMIRPACCRPAATLRSSGDSLVGRGAASHSPATASTRAAASGGVPALIVHADPVGEGEGCPRGSQWTVQKFGGTCVSSAERIAAAAQLVLKSALDGQQQVHNHRDLFF